MSRAPLHPVLRRAGFTLVEVVVSLLVTSVLLGAMVSAILVASHAMPDPDRPETAAVNAATALESIATELETALTIVTLGENEIEFTVADRASDEDTDAETIRYGWSGEAGTPLWRKFNTDAAVAIVDSVDSFVVTPTTVLADAGAAPTVESAEQVFAAQDVTDTSGSGTEIYGTFRMSCSLTPDLPADAQSWRITRVRIRLSPDGSGDETLAVSVDPADPGDGSPSGEPVQTVVVDENDLSSDSWHQVDFSAAGGLDPALPYHIVLARNSGLGAAASIHRSTDGAATPETSTWVDSGLSIWTELPNSDLPMWIWGTYATVDPDWAATAPSYVTSVAFELRAGDPPGRTARLQVTTLNTPEVP